MNRHDSSLFIPRTTNIHASRTVNYCPLPPPPTPLLASTTYPLLHHRSERTPIGKADLISVSAFGMNSANMKCVYTAPRRLHHICICRGDELGCNELNCRQCEVCNSALLEDLCTCRHCDCMICGEGDHVCESHATCSFELAADEVSLFSIIIMNRKKPLTPFDLHTSHPSPPHNSPSLPRRICCWCCRGERRPIRFALVDDITRSRPISYAAFVCLFTLT